LSIKNNPTFIKKIDPNIEQIMMSGPLAKGTIIKVKPKNRALQNWRIMHIQENAKLITEWNSFFRIIRITDETKFDKLSDQKTKITVHYHVREFFLFPLISRFL
jgi:hypothetical protein